MAESLLNIPTISKTVERMIPVLEREKPLAVFAEELSHPFGMKVHVFTENPDSDDLYLLDRAGGGRWPRIEISIHTLPANYSDKIITTPDEALEHMCGKGNWSQVYPQSPNT